MCGRSALAFVGQQGTEGAAFADESEGKRVCDEIAEQVRHAPSCHAHTPTQAVRSVTRVTHRSYTHIIAATRVDTHTSQPHRSVVAACRSHA
jgi:hypothetical protein